jgi:predicted anti-sigma-YlaC factor YlaD
MTESPEHISSGILHQYIDGTLADPDLRAVATHLDGCPACRAAWAAFVRIDGSLKHLPLEKAPRSLTASVMDRLNLTPRRDRAYVLLTHTGTVFAFLVVAAILIGVFLWTGVIDPGGGESDPGTPEWLGAAGDTLAGAAQGAGSMTTKFFSFFSSQGGAAVLLFGVVVVGFLGVADFLFRRGSLRN